MSYQNFRPTSRGSLPEVVKNLLIINGIVYLATILLAQRGIDLVRILGLHYFASDQFRIWQIVSYMFMHDIGQPGNISFMHILMNMFILFMFGPMVEMVWGNKRFLKYYMLTGIGAAVTHYFIVYLQINPEINFLNKIIASQSLAELSAVINNATGSGGIIDQFSKEIIQDGLSLDRTIQFAASIKSQIYEAIPPVIGASGAVFGILLAYGMLFPNSILYLFFAIPIRAKYAVVLFGVMELYYGIRGGDNVAHFAHLGGLLTGLIIILLERNRPWKKNNDYFN